MLHKQLQTGEKKLTAAAAAEKQAHKRKWQPTDQRQHTDATYVTKIATLTLVSTATGGAAQAEQTAWTSNRWIIIIHGHP